ncbi:Sensory box histidine kinase/response regulator [hydrothermal vent metagenome]|uniref:histidine kinase n=1 Tax=hydrothermal vent metagenome TaxID=652676 RepID=A0A3B1AX97_9ZZZZ
MHNAAKVASHKRPTKKYHSLSATLVSWFLILSLLPLITISWYSFQRAEKDLTQAAKENLEQSASLSVNFINTWFDYRIRDLNTQAELHNNIELLSELENGFIQSGKPLSEYVKSYDWIKRVDNAHSNLTKLSREYDYIYDLFLIDTNGNIIYSIMKEADFGTNLFTGPYAHTMFSNSIKATLQTGQVNFSGLERYAPSNNQLAGFISAPLINENGSQIGIFVIQLRLDRIFKLINFSSHRDSLIHYLVAKDGTLRTPLGDDNWDSVTARKIHSIQFQRWKQEQEQEQEQILKYTGPNNQEVIGIRQEINLANINWLLISEIDTNEALASAHSLSQVIFLLVIIATALVSTISLYLARRITQPIITLADTSMKIAAGEITKKINTNSKNEIGRLADAFNHMITVRRKYNNELKIKSEQAQQALIDLEMQKFALDQHVIVAITDVNGTITFNNEKFSEISGYSSQELIGKNHRMLNSGHHEKSFFIEMYRSISSGKVWHAEICNKAKDGHHYWVDTTIVPIMNTQGKPESYIAIRTDISNIKLIEANLIEARNKAEEAARAKSEFLASMSHEIRTPINGVLGMLGLLQNSTLNDEQQHRVKVAQSSAKSLLTLINDILDFSKIDANKLELEIIDFDLRSMLGEFSEAMAYQAQLKSIELILDLKGIEQSMVKGDPGRLRQILTNLVSNAIKFTSEGEVVIHVELQDQPDDKISFICSVSDTGIGIPADKINSLFLSFTQVDASTTRKYGGTGLGLTIAKNLCELMAGDIQVSSVEGEGSCFSLNLILEKSQRAQLIMPSVDINTLSILIVDDNETNREVLREQLTHWGARVEEAESGQQALQICTQFIQKNSSLFDIAFLDMQMPEMDGVELSKRLRKNPQFSDMKLVMMTSMSHQGDAKYFAELGFSGYFPKPATTSDIFDALAVVAENGPAFEQAAPLVTHHYLKSLISNTDADALKNDKIIWPVNTRILLVEDNQINQLVATGILNEIGLQADIAANGLEALSSLKLSPSDAPYSLILMDCQMPEMDGYQATHQIRASAAGERYKSIAIIAMTANAMSGDRDNCINAGMNDYISKPVDANQLSSKIQQWLPDVQSISMASTNTQLTDEDETPSEDPNLSVWDKEAALKRIMGKESLMKMLIDVFLNETPEKIKQLQTSIGNADIEQIHLISHTLKGVTANLSGLRVQQQAALMEQAAKHSDIGTVKSIMPVLVQELSTLVDCFQSERKPELYPVSVLDKDGITQLLTELDTKLNDCEFIDPQELDPLINLSDEPPWKKMTTNLYHQIAQLDNDSALNTINNIKTYLGIE